MTCSIKLPTYQREIRITYMNTGRQPFCEVSLHACSNLKCEQFCMLSDYLDQDMIRFQSQYTALVNTVGHTL